MNVYNSHVTKCVMTLMEDLNALVMTDMSLLWMKQSAMVRKTLIGLGHDIVNSLTSLDLRDQLMLHNLVPMHINGTYVDEYTPTNPLHPDINECSVAALNGTEICMPPMFCINLAGSYRCECPGGTILTNGVCLEIGENVEQMNRSLHDSLCTPIGTQ